MTSTASHEQVTFLEWWVQLPTIQAFGISAGFWAMVLALLWAWPFASLKFKQEGADRVMSAFHAIIATILGVLVEIYAAPSCKVGHSWVRGPPLVLLGYLAVDLVSMLVCDVWQGWRNVDVSMMIHHVAILTMFGLGSEMDIAVYFASTLLINEASTPFMSMMWYLTYSEQKDSTAFLVNGIVFTLMFFLCRVLFIPFNIYQFASIGFCTDMDKMIPHPTALDKYAPYIAVCGYIFILTLNLIWFRKLLMGAVKKLRKTKGEDEAAEKKLLDHDDIRN